MENSECMACGGCAFRSLGLAQYRENKQADFTKVLQKINGAAPLFDEPIFIDDGSRRRAGMEFLYSTKKLKVGFYEAQSHNLIDIQTCAMLDPVLNEILPQVRRFLEEFCTIPITAKKKQKKNETQYIHSGSIQLLHADNGVDILLKLQINPALEHRLSVADFVNANENICRLSWAIDNGMPEIVVEKFPPELYILGTAVNVPPGVFLQTSKMAENAMITKVLSYIGDTSGKLADLFCGLGTFTYPLSQIKGSEIIAADSSKQALQGLRQALNRNQIHNVKVIERNLFKYPFDAMDMQGIKAIVMDPPRAGAHNQCREITMLSANARPQKIVYVSCNPKTFVYDAEQLINAGYVFERVTLIDQFVYSKHQELIALFTYNPKIGVQ